jgi:hypothetical protein
MTDYSPHTLEILEFFLKKTMSVYAEKVKFPENWGESTCYHILLPNHNRTNQTINKLVKLLEPKNGYLYTENGGVYFKDTFFGNIDIYFTEQK